MKHLQLFDKSVRVNEAGFICLNDLHKASGSDPKNRPTDFLRTKHTKLFIESLESKVGIPTLDFIKGGKEAGTWAHKLLCYKYASFIRPDFEVGVYDVLDRFFTGKQTTEPFYELQDWARRQLDCENKGSFHGKGLSHHRGNKQKLHDEGEDIIGKIQIKIEFKA